MKQLISGFNKFRRDVFPAQRDHFLRLAKRQHPEALFITCSDSRVAPDLITQSKPGDLFVCRTAGNIVPPYGEAFGGVSATIEYAVVALGVKDIIVCGHSDCGAMHAVLHPERMEKLPVTRSWLRYADAARHIVRENYPELSEDQAHQAVTKENVVTQLDNLRTHPSVAARMAKGDLNIHGWIYDIPNGQIAALDPNQGLFALLDAETAPAAAPRRHLHAVAS